MSEAEAQTGETPREQLPANLPELASKYEIRSVLGQGAMALVLDAFDRILEREVAIKVQLLNGNDLDGKLQERFVLEAKTLLQLDHPNIVKMLGSGISAAGQPYIVMEKLAGFSLREELGEAKTINPSRFLGIFIQVAAGLDFVHRQGIVHRDLKPSNIFLAQDQTGVCAKLIDFGIARELAEESTAVTLTKTAAVIGTPNYMSPEQCLGKAAALSSDIYSLGCVMYEAITGFPPFVAESPLEVIYKHVNADWQHLEDLADSTQSKKLARLVDSCLTKEAELRPTAAQVQSVLQRTRDEMTSSARLYYKREGPKRKAQTFAKAVLALLVVSSIGAAGISVLKQKQPTDVKQIEGINYTDPKEQLSKILRQAKVDFERTERLLKQARDDSEHERFLAEYLKTGKEFAEQAEKFKRPAITENVLLKLEATALHEKNAKTLLIDIYKRLADSLMLYPSRQKDAETYFLKARELTDDDATGDKGIILIDYTDFLIRVNRLSEAKQSLVKTIPFLRDDKLGLLHIKLESRIGKNEALTSSWSERELASFPDKICQAELKNEEQKIAALQICNIVMTNLIATNSPLCKAMIQDVEGVIGKATISPKSAKDTKQLKLLKAQTEKLLAQIKKLSRQN